MDWTSFRAVNSQHICNAKGQQPTTFLAVFECFEETSQTCASEESKGLGFQDPSPSCHLLVMICPLLLPVLAVFIL